MDMREIQRAADAVMRTPFRVAEIRKQVTEERRLFWISMHEVLGDAVTSDYETLEGVASLLSKQDPSDATESINDTQLWCNAAKDGSAFGAMDSIYDALEEQTRGKATTLATLAAQAIPTSQNVAQAKDKLKQHGVPAERLWSEVLKELAQLMTEQVHPTLLKEDEFSSALVTCRVMKCLSLRDKHE